MILAQGRSNSHMLWVGGVCKRSALLNTVYAYTPLGSSIWYRIASASARFGWTQTMGGLACCGALLQRALPITFALFGAA